MLEQMATHVLAAVAGGALGAVSMAMLAASGRAGENPHAWKLDSVCWIRTGGGWEPKRIVAVSHEGAIAVRDAFDGEGCRKAMWVNKRAAGNPDIVAFEEPGE